MIEYWKYINLGIMLVAPAIVGLLIGNLIDRGFKTLPVFTVSMLVLGILSGIWSMYKSVKNLV
jgi:F0F1-type ATP synthase assembly protein I